MLSRNAPNGSWAMVKADLQNGRVGCYREIPPIEAGKATPSTSLLPQIAELDNYIAANSGLLHQRSKAPVAGPACSIYGSTLG